MLAPIVLFIYNRPEHTRKVIEALQKNEFATESILYVFADGPKVGSTPEQQQLIDDTRKYVKGLQGFKEVIIEASEKNNGLANSVISGVTKIINQYGKVIVVEDDLITHRFFLRFMNDALNYYEYDKRLFMIGGCNVRIKMPLLYCKDVYLAHRSCSWGWGTWKDRWSKADWSVSDYENFANNKSEVVKFNRGGSDMAPMLRAQMEGRIDSWAIRWDYCLYKNDAYCLRPVKTLVHNIGCDGTGVHCGSTDILSRIAPKYNAHQYKIKLVRGIKAERKIETAFYRYYSGIKKIPIWKQVIGRIKRFTIFAG